MFKEIVKIFYLFKNSHFLSFSSIKLRILLNSLFGLCIMSNDSFNLMFSFKIKKSGKTIPRLYAYFIPKVFGTLPLVNGDGEFTTAVWVTIEPTVIIVPYILAERTW